jgi:large repetitive protein
MRAGGRSRMADAGALGRDIATPAGAVAAQPQAGQAEGGDEESEGRRVGSIAVWSGGSVDISTLDARSGRSKISATSAGLSAGMDIKLADGVVVGAGGGYGSEVSLIGGGAARLRAEGTTVAAYASLSPIEGTFIDGMFGYGDLNMRLRRNVEATDAVALGSRDGKMTFGAVSAGIDRFSNALRWSAYGRFDFMNADLGAYRETGAGRYDLRFDQRSLQSLTGTLGARIETTQKTSFGAMSPRLRVEWRHEFADADPQFLDYADIVGPAFYRIDTVGWTRDQFQLAVGSRLALPSFWTVDLDLGFTGGQGSRAGTLRIGISKEF